VNPRFLPFEKNSPRKVCRWCKARIPASNLRIYYCGKVCETEYLVRRLASVATREVRKRDKGVCRMCGLDTTVVSAILRRMLSDLRSKGVYDYYEFSKFLRMIGIPRNRFRRLWDVHHVVPVCDGGGGCGTENLVAACVWCHKDETRKMHNRLTKQR